MKKCKCLVLTSWRPSAKKGPNTGRSSHPLYKTWESMKRRCNAASTSSKENYAGRGIGICLPWISSFEAFAKDVGVRPAGKTLDRVDNNSGYCPHNFRWASPLLQGRNRRNHVSKGLPHGVHRNEDGRKKKFAVRFKVKGKTVFLGNFICMKEAANVASKFKQKQVP